MISIDLLSFILFIIVLAALVIYDRKKVKFEGLAFMRRTDKANKFIDRVAKRHKSTWNILSWIGIVVAFIALVLGSYYLINNAIAILQGAVTVGAGLVLPGPVSAPTAVPGVFIVPWWIWIIGIAVVIVPHEFFHGIMSRLCNVRVKSVGWFLFVILPGAFVEPDERQLRRSKRSTKLKVYAAGSFANFLTAFILLLIIISAASLADTSNPSAIYFQRIEGTPADEANLTGFITNIGGFSITTQQDVSNAMANFKPNNTVEVTTHKIESVSTVFNGDFQVIFPSPIIHAELGEVSIKEVTLAEHPNAEGKAYLGIANMITIHSGLDILTLQILNLLVWIYIFSFGIGLFNILPIKPFDGGHVLQEILSKFTKHDNLIIKIISIIMAVVVIFNIFGVFII